MEGDLHVYYVYIMASHPRDGSLYIGITNAIARRLLQHQGKQRGGALFAKKYQTDLLVYVESHATPQAAILREKQVKKWNRAWKVRLIESANPGWKNLEEFLQDWL